MKKQNGPRMRALVFAGLLACLVLAPDSYALKSKATLDSLVAGQNVSASQGTPSSAGQQSVMFTGTIVQKDGEYVLQKSDGTYKLDSQEKAKRFEGQIVRVMGTLDAATKTIYISEIKAVS